MIKRHGYTVFVVIFSKSTKSIKEVALFLLKHYTELYAENILNKLCMLVKSLPMMAIFARKFFQMHLST